MIAIAGGATGGHLGRARALKNSLNDVGIKPVFMGTTAHLDREWFRDEQGFDACYFFNVRSVVDRAPLDKLGSLGRALAGSMRALRVLRHHDIRAVISVGGYAAAPGCLAAVASGRPLFLHEHNTILGGLHKSMKPFARGIFNPFLDGAMGHGIAVPDAYFETRRVRSAVAAVLFVGGSQGSRVINDFAIKAAPALLARGLKVIHQTGAADFERVQTHYRDAELAVEVFPFDANFAEPMGRADLAVSRAGAGILWEAAANGLPALLVPQSFSAQDHQTLNAEHFAGQGLGWWMPEEEVSVDTLLECVNEDLTDRSRRLADLLEPYGADRVIDKILESIEWEPQKARTRRGRS